MTIFLVSTIFIGVYIALLISMRRLNVVHPPDVHFGFLFLVAFLWVIQPLTPHNRLVGGILFSLILVAPTVLLLCSTLLFRRPERTVFHKLAMWGGWLYFLAAVALVIVAGLYA
jgi:hypothetical protein